MAERIPQADRPAVIGFDGSDDARRAIDVAAAVLAGGPAVVVHVWKPFMSGAFRHGPKIQLTETIRGSIAEMDEIGERQAHAVAAEGAGIARRAGFEPVQAVAEPATDSVSAKLLEIAAAHDARMVVAGAGGHGGHGILGGVSHGLMSHANRPVLVVPRDP